MFIVLSECLSSGIPTSQPLVAELEIYTRVPWHQFPHQGQVLVYVEQFFRKIGKFNFAKGGRSLCFEESEEP
jgi:hypothetical protein